ncbi:alanine/ornithine racemase family PLP-dependent enzyme [Oceanirhabdus seepicola]|uniref:Alanine/ornithine racemase family PLP-dependent enzyme n=1 Tax=Oceanirhabdus seepicola TaxID=2828781 RepID=A0A9J6P230_9CLOT|nr:alanine/ornithine racemase family PLP-dependent enzyme [Oceanirhabdus seepicola]
MIVRYPCLEVDLKKVEENTRFIVDKCSEKGIKSFVVMKVYCGFKEIAEASLRGGAYGLADSRVQNLEKVKELDCPKLLLRIPMKSEAHDVVRLADISLNSEIETIMQLDEEARNQGTVHKIILMIDLGDLREGVWFQSIDTIVEDILKLKNIKLHGIGTNLTCYGGVMPDDENLGKLLEIKNEIEKKHNITLETVSGGNSSSLYKVLNDTMPEGVNMLRIGETIVLGRETAYGELVEGMHEDAFTLKGEIVELKKKPSVPIGTIGMDAFGNKPTFEDRGEIRRAIIAVGRQDVNPDGLDPLDEKIDILGASSDHLLMDVTNSSKEYRVGDIIEFKVDYGALLNVSTSEYVAKVFK